MTTTDERVAELLAKTPPLSAEQRAGLARILVNARRQEGRRAAA